MKTQVHQHHLQQRGLTLIELIAALGIAAVIIVGALSLYRNADNSQKANAALQDMTAIQQAVRGLYQGNYVNGANFETDLVTINRWPATANNINVVGSANNTYTLTITNVTNSTCVSIISAATGWISARGIAGIAASNVTPVVGNAAILQCTRAGAGNMTFVGQ